MLLATWLAAVLPQKSTQAEEHEANKGPPTWLRGQSIARQVTANPGPCLHKQKAPAHKGPGLFALMLLNPLLQKPLELVNADVCITKNGSQSASRDCTTFVYRHGDTFPVGRST